MSRISSMMDVGQRALANSQTALQTISHNIANKNTPGFSRQEVHFETAEPVSDGNIRLGMGAKVASLSRVHDAFVEKELAQAKAKLGYLQDRADTLGEVQSIYNEQLNKGLNTEIGKFFNSLRALANNPDNLASRTLVKENANALTQNFRAVNSRLRRVQNGIDFQITSKVQEINGYTREIAELNRKIKEVEITGANANDERDKRNLLLKKLGSLIDIRYAEGQDGTVTVSAAGSAILVAGYDSHELDVKSTPAHGDKREGDVDIFYKNKKDSTPIRLTGMIKGGSLGALLETRDKTVNHLLNDMDHMAYSLASQINKVHSEGYDQYNKKGENFFILPHGEKDASRYIEVNKDILHDVGKIAAAGKPGAPGDNTTINRMADLEYRPILADGTASLNQYYDSVVGQVGVMTRRAKTDEGAQKDIVKQLTNLRESISGVSLDEETAKMIEFQKSFDASARMIKTADELLNTVLHLKND